MRKQTKIAALVSAAALLAIGASMTASANTWSGVNGTMDWTWVDSQGNPIEEEGWHRGNADWGANSQYYYFSDENGSMVSSQTVEYGDDLYYVDELGRRVTNTWVLLDLEDEYEMPDNEIVSSVYYFFDSKGKAVHAADSDFVAKEEIKDTGRSDKGYFVFNRDGYMTLGRVDVGGDIYYCVQKDDSNYIELPQGATWDYVTGQALNGWAKMEVDLLLEEAEIEDDYAIKEWFYFDKGKLYQPANGGTKTIDGVTYAFDENGVLGQWTGKTVASNSNANPGPNSTYKVYVNSNDFTTVSGNKWEDVGDYNWRYIINAREADKSLIQKGVIFNYNYDGMDGTDPATGKVFEDGKGYSRMIKVNGKIFLIGPDGLMKTGVQEITPATLRAWGEDYDSATGKFVWNDTYAYYVPEALQDIATGYAEMMDTAFAALKDAKSYYFNFDDSKDLDGDRGEQLTGKYSYTDDDDNNVTRIFATDGVVAEGYALYGDYLYKDGELVVAEDGDTYTYIDLKDQSNKIRQYTVKGSKVEKYTSTSGKELNPSPASATYYYVVVDKNGKVKKNSSSKGLTIEDLTFVIDTYIATIKPES